jgi:TetR/AcrR family transcriptional regulator, regulator of autoinduction and epiphytic fitness
MVSIVKNAAYWPQVTMGQRPLNLREQRKTARAAAELFLSYYSA